MEPGQGPARPHTVFILPELAPQRLDHLTLLILADGNRRGASGGGYAGGARRVVSIAEHLARRADVAAMVACVLSPDNIARRGDGFFLALYKEFIQLGVEIEARGALVASRIRAATCGDLASLRARGGHAVALADAIEAVVAATAGVETPALRLVLGVGYGRDAARALGVDIVLRTGMEEPGVLRLSGLQPGEGMASCAITTLWPEVEPREVDEVIEHCKRRASPRFATGHGAARIAEIVEALARAELAAPVVATITASATPAETAAALEHLYAGPRHAGATVAVEHVGAASPRFGRSDALHLVRVFHVAPTAPTPGVGEHLSVLAPGQDPSLFTLPDWLPLGHANVHACAATAAGVVEGIRAAVRFASAHPALLGGERVTELRAPGAAAAPAGASERDAIGDRFAARTLAWAASTGLLLPGEAWRRAALNYALTAFFIHFRIPTEWDEAGAHWEARADLTARYMILVAAGDEGIFDHVIEGETPAQRWARLEVSSRFLQGALRSAGARDPVPRVPGAELLATLAEQWRALLEPHRGVCHPAIEASFREGLESLYAASLAEHGAGIGAEQLTEGGRFDRSPPLIAARARALAEGGHPAAGGELRALAYLAEVGSAIGAGLLFRTAALAAPAASVPWQSVAALEAATTLLDYHVRLSNDASGFLDAPGGDRDPKENACTILVPRSSTGVARAAAVVQALATCRRLAAFLAGEVGAHLERVAAAWPSMGVILRRGTFVGRRVYEVGHYTTVSRAEMSAIFDELGEAPARPRRPSTAPASSQLRAT
jgi:hypothetical protein